MPAHHALSKSLVSLVLAVAITSGANSAHATEAWENGRAYTIMLEDKAKAAAAFAALAAARAAAAAQDLTRAKARLAALRAAGAATAAALQAVIAAEAALATATAVAASAKTAAVAATVVVAGIAAGTYTAQGLRGIWDWCWDPLCDVTAIAPGAASIYVPFSQAEAEALLPSITSLATGGELTISQSDFDETGIPSGYVTEGFRLFVGATRGAAAGTDHRWSEVLFAVADLQPALAQYRALMRDYADVVESTSYVDPTSLIATERGKFDAQSALALGACQPGYDDCERMASDLSAAKNDFDLAQAALAEVDWATLVSNPLIAPLTIAEFQQFIVDCGNDGAAALPPEEIDVADALLAAAGAYYPGQPSQGSMIAAYDAIGDTLGHESALFDPVTGELTLADLLRDSATILSSEGPWLNIDLYESPLTAEATSGIAAIPALGAPARLLLLVLFSAAVFLAVAYRRARHNRAGE